MTPEIKDEAENSIKEFIELFKGRISFTENIVAEEQKAKLSEELGITVYPAFLVNNQFKIGGFQSSKSLKDKFCELNNLDECK